MQSAFFPSAVGKLPRREILYADLLASIIFCSLPGRAALDVIDVLEGVPKEFFLVLAMWAPPCPVHLRTALIHTFCEAIQGADRLAIVSEMINRPCHDCDRCSDNQPFQSWRRFRVVCACVRHSGILIPRHSARPAAPQDSRSAR